MKETSSRSYSNPHNWLGLVPFDAAFVVVSLLLGRRIDPVQILQILAQLAILIPLHVTACRPIAKVEDGALKLLSGVGINEPDEIPLESITATERLTRRFLNIRHAGGIISVEAAPAVLDEMEADLAPPGWNGGRRWNVPNARAQSARALTALCAVLIASCDGLTTPTGYDSFTAPQGYDTSGSSRFLEVAAVCIASHRDDKEANLDAIDLMVASVMAGHPDTDVIVFPELCTSWLYVEADPATYYRSVAETIPGPSTDRVAALASRYGVSIVFGLAEVDGERWYNAQALVKPDGSVVRYRKRGLNPGDIANGCSPGSGVVTAEIDGVGVTFAICSDYQDEATIRDLSLCDAPVVLASLVTATVLNPAVDFFARSVGKWVVYANGAGENSGASMPGGIFIADPTGTVHDPHAGAGSYAWQKIGVP